MYSLSKSKTLKKLKVGLFRQKGRNTSGRITVYHRGGGYNQVFRVIDYKRYF